MENYELGLDEFNKRYMITKEDIKKGIQSTINQIMKIAETDGRRSAAYYHILQNLVGAFIKKLDETLLMEKLEDFWSYDFDISYSGISLVLQHSEFYGYVEQINEYHFNVDQRFTLFEVKTKLLTVEEYADIYGTEVGTVRQWIRRGKIRTAMKYGNEWRIPELTDSPQRGYISACYEWKDGICAVDEEYAFLHDYERAVITQDDDNKSLYYIYFYVNNDLYAGKVIECDMKTREKYELCFISNPDIHYRQEYREAFLPDLMRAYNEEE